MTFRMLCTYVRDVFEVLIGLLFPPTPLLRKVRGLSPSLLSREIKRTESGGAVALFPYRNPLIRAAIHLLKYQKDRRIADLFAAVLHDMFAEEIGNAVVIGDSSDRERPLLVPVPLSPKRRRERGYNQCEILAEALVAHAGEGWYTYAPNVLEKARETPPQTSCASRAERVENLRGAFSLTRHAVSSDILSGRTVIVLDDVMTTGATLSEARRALRGARGGPNKPARIITIALAH